MFTKDSDKKTRPKGEPNHPVITGDLAGLLSYTIQEPDANTEAKPVKDLDSPVCTGPVGLACRSIIYTHPTTNTKPQLNIVFELGFLCGHGRYSTKVWMWSAFRASCLMMRA